MIEWVLNPFNHYLFKPTNTMLIYNVTINVENDVRDQWVHWMKTEHMPAVIATLMLNFQILEVKHSYAVQFRFRI